MLHASKIKLLAAVAAVVPAVAAVQAMAQTVTFVSFGGPGTQYTQDFNTLPFGIANTTLGFSGTAGAAIVTRNNTLGSAGLRYDLGNADPNPATSLLYDAFQASTLNTYPLTTTNAVGGGTQIVVTTTAVQPILTPTQATDAFNRAAGALQGWSVAQYIPAATANANALRFLADNGGPSNTGSVRSVGPSARNIDGSGLIQNGTVVATGATFDVNTTDTNAFPFQDRALGAIGSGTSNNLIALTLRNDSTSLISSVNLNAFVEQWRHGTSPTDTFRGSFLITDTAPDDAVFQSDTQSTSTFTRSAELDLFSNNVPGTPEQTGINGNSSTYRIAKSASVPLLWAPGQYLVLRFVDFDSQGNDDVLSLDDVTITATGASIASGARFLTYTGAQDSTLAVNGSSNYVTNSASATLATGDVVTLDDTGLAASTITVGAGTSLSQLNVANTSGTYTLNGGGLTTNTGLFKSEGGTLVLNNGANDFGPFGIRASGGVVEFTNPDQLGSAALPVILSGGAVLATSTADLAANTVSLGASGGGISNSGLVTLGTLSGAGKFEKTGAGNLVINNYFATGGFRLSGGTVTLALGPSQQVNFASTDGSTLNGDLVLSTPTRINFNNPSATDATFGGSGNLFVDASGSTFSTLDAGTFFSSIQTPIILNRNNLPGFVFNIFPAFSGSSRLQLDAPVTGPGGSIANASINFAAGSVNGNGSVLVNQPILLSGNVTINIIGGTAGGVAGGGFVALGVTNGLPTTATLGFNTASGFNQGSSGTGFLSLGNSIVGQSFSQTVSGLFSGNGDAPRTTFNNVATAFGGVASTITGTDPIATQFTLNIAAGQTFTYTGQLRDLFSLIKTGPGVQRLGAVYFGTGTGGVPQTSNYTGTTEIREGTIEAFGGANRLSFNAPLEIGNAAAGTTGTLILAGISQTVSALATSGSSLSNQIIANVGSVNGTATQTATLTVRSLSFDDTVTYPQDRFREFETSTFAGTLTDGTASLSIIKTGPQTGTAALAGDVGTLRLTGNLAYSGDTRVLGGRLIVENPLRPLNVNPASTLGTVAVTGSSRLTVNVTPNALAAGARNVVQVNSIEVNSGGLLTIALVDRAISAPSVIETNAIVHDNTGLIDLGTSDLIVHTTNTSEGTLRAAVQTWYNGGARDGNGLGTTAITQGVPNAALTTLAVFSNFVDEVTAFYSTYDGIDLAPTDTIVKYTYLGDTNIDGVVDAIDYANLIEGFSTGATGWQNGDFDYDNVVSIADFTLFFQTFGNAALPSLGNGAGTSNGGGAIPEPSALGLMVPAVALLTRRRR